MDLLSPLTYSLSLSLSTGFVGLGPFDFLLDGGSVDPSACISFCSDWHRRLFSATDSRRLHSSTSSSHAFLVCWAGPLCPLTCPLILLDSFSTGFDFLDLDLFDSLLGGGVAFFFCYPGDLDHLTFYIYEASRAKACCGSPTLGAPLS